MKVANLAEELKKNETKKEKEKKEKKKQCKTMIIMKIKLKAIQKEKEFSK